MRKISLFLLLLLSVALCVETSVFINSQPPMAKVYEYGEIVGTTNTEPIISEPGLHRYRIKKGDLEAKINVTLGEGKNTIPLIRLKKPEKIKEAFILKVNFLVGKATLTYDSREFLDDVVSSLKAWPSVKIEIRGHTDNIGTAESNRRLSLKRANVIVDYLVEQGIKPQRLRAIGVGEAEPVASNSSAEGRAINNRIVISRIPNVVSIHEWSPEQYGMKRIPGGKFSMGSNSGDDEKPIHSVIVSSFWMDSTEVTQGEYFRLMGGSIASLRDKANPGWPLRGTGRDYPVYYVSWWDAIRYCNARSHEAGLAPVYNENTGEIDWSLKGYRLPTEAEWEYACRAGSSWKYYWGDSPGLLRKGGTSVYANGDEAHGWPNDGVGKGTAQVASYHSNNFGLYDMSGNVWEWCNDWYSSHYYSSSPSKNPRGPIIGSKRVKRGGGWYDGPDNLRSAKRFNGVPDNRSYYLGFRCVLSGGNRAPISNDAYQLYLNAHTSFMSEDLETAESKFKKIQQDFAGTEYGIIASYWIAEIYVLRKNNSEAIRYYKDFVSKAYRSSINFGKYFPTSIYMIGNLYEKDGDIARRDAYWQKLIELCPYSKEANLIKYKYEQ